MKEVEFLPLKLNLLTTLMSLCGYYKTVSGCTFRILCVSFQRESVSALYHLVFTYWTTIFITIHNFEKKVNTQGRRLLLFIANSFWPRGLQHAKLTCPSLSPWVCSNPCPSSQWCHPTISSSVAPFSSCLQSFPALGYFPMSQFFASGGQSIEASASATVIPMNVRVWFPLGLTGLISLLFKGLSRVFYSTTVWKHQFFGAQPSLWLNSHICTWLLEKP